MKDIMGMMKQMQGLQSKMADMQAQMEAASYVGSAAGGMVKVTLTGKGAIKGVSIDESLLKPEEREIIEDLIVAAHNDAKGKSDMAMAEKMQAMTGGLSLPPGMKLPF